MSHSVISRSGVVQAADVEYVTVGGACVEVVEAVEYRLSSFRFVRPFALQKLHFQP